MKTDRPGRHIAVAVQDSCKNLNPPISRIRKLVRAICARFDVVRANINIDIVDNTEIKRLNRKFLGRRAVTDVISFNLSDDETTGPRLFDLAVNGQLAQERAAERGIETAAELALYITHGLLHNFGFDDSTRQKAQRMHKAEDQILQHLGYGIVYSSQQSR